MPQLLQQTYCTALPLLSYFLMLKSPFSSRVTPVGRLVVVYEELVSGAQILYGTFKFFSLPTLWALSRLSPPSFKCHVLCAIPSFSFGREGKTACCAVIIVTFILWGCHVLCFGAKHFSDCVIPKSTTQYFPCLSFNKIHSKLPVFQTECVISLLCLAWLAGHMNKPGCVSWWLFVLPDNNWNRGK